VVGRSISLKLYFLWCHTCSQDRSASGTLQVSAKFQVITVPVLTDKVVLMKWHALSSKSSKHDSVDRKHDSFGVKRVSHGQMLPAAHGSHGDFDRVGCVFARAQQHTSEPEESRDHKPRLRFDMQAERRYSVTAKPLYHPSVDAQPSSEGIIVKRRHAEQSGASLREGLSVIVCSVGRAAASSQRCGFARTQLKELVAWNAIGRNPANGL
jgi:hypothetical protein